MVLFPIGLKCVSLSPQVIILLLPRPTATCLITWHASHMESHDMWNHEENITFVINLLMNIFGRWKIGLGWPCFCTLQWPLAAFIWSSNFNFPVKAYKWLHTQVHRLSEFLLLYWKEYRCLLSKVSIVFNFHLGLEQQFLVLNAVSVDICNTRSINW